MDLSPAGLWSLIQDRDLHGLNEFGTVSDIAKLLESDIETGITSTASLASRVHQYGSNVLPDRPVRSFFQMLIEALNDQTLLILIGCAIFSLVFEIIFASTEERSTAWIDGAAILMAVCIVSLVQATSNHKQELQFAAINRIKSIFDVTVIRSGKILTVSNTNLVVGDVVVLSPGDCIPADGLLIKGDDMKIDESIACGESEAISKSVHSDPFLIGGTHVVEGRGTFLVLCVGLNSQNGRVFALLDHSQKPTPLQEKLEDLASQIGYLGMAAAALTFAALFLGWLAVRFREGFSWVSCKDVLTYLIDSLTIVVVAVPEGLPLAVTISLAYSMHRMMADNNFVRRLQACETMGSATVICTDKTGTLTMNQMAVEYFIVGDDIFPATKLLDDTAPGFVDQLALAIGMNTTAVITDDNLSIGSQTECALLRLLKGTLHLNISEVRQRAAITKSFPFDQSRKLMATFTSANQAFVKGAPEVLLPYCRFFTDRRGVSYPLDDAMRQSLQLRVDEHCARAYRLLAICTSRATEIIPDITDLPLTLVGIACVRDSLRPSTSDAILKCQRAGIRVVMITGDHLLTGEAIARECGISSALSQSICGAELRSMSPDKLGEVVGDVSVVARSTPMDKHAVVLALQQRGEVVAVTGDGTNDVAALMQADVGLAMGRSGTELAKEASDIVVLDDNFASIVAAVSWGRCIFNNVRRFLQFQLTANVVTLFISFMAAVVLHDTPFKAVQLLWVNLIMDSLGALALATGRPHEGLLARPPQRRRAPLISQFMVQNIAGQAIFQVVVVAVFLVWHGDIPARSLHHYTLLFNVFVYCQMFNLVNARVVEFGDSVVAGILDNVLFVGILVGIGVVEFLLVQFGGGFFACVPLSAGEQVLSLAIASLALPVGWVIRRSPESFVLHLIRPLKRFHVHWTRGVGA